MDSKYNVARIYFAVFADAKNFLYAFINNLNFIKKWRVILSIYLALLKNKRFEAFVILKLKQWVVYLVILLASFL